MDGSDAPAAPTRRSRRVWGLLVLGVGVLAFGVLLVFGGGSPDDSPSIEGITFEGFRDDDPVVLSELTGRPLVINAWASWCAPCVEEMPDLQQVYTEVGGRIGFLGVNVQDDPERAQELIERTGVTYPLAADPDMRIFQALGGVGMPTTWFVNEEGVVVERHTGLLTADELRDLIGDLLGS